jgi:hypothetical protein
MPKRKADTSTLSAMTLGSSEIEFSESDEGLTFAQNDSSAENIAPVKKARAAASSTRAVKPTRAPSRRVSGAGAKKSAAVKSNTGSTSRKKAVLKEQRYRTGSETEEVEDFEDDVMPGVTEVTEAVSDDELDSPEAPKTKGRTARSGKASATNVSRATKAAPTKSTKRKVVEEVDSADVSLVPTEPSPVKSKSAGSTTTSGANIKKSTASQSRAAAAKGRTGRKVAEKEIQETQFSPMDVDEQSGEDNTVVAPSSSRQLAHARASSKSRQTSATRKRAGSASDTEKAGSTGDAGVRRRLGEMTKKFENVDLRNRTMKDSLTEAETNYKKMKKTAEERIKSECFVIYFTEDPIANKPRRRISQCLSKS